MIARSTRGFPPGVNRPGRPVPDEKTVPFAHRGLMCYKTTTIHPLNRRKKHTFRTGHSPQLKSMDHLNRFLATKKARDPNWRLAPLKDREAYHNMRDVHGNVMFVHPNFTDPPVIPPPQVPVNPGQLVPFIPGPIVPPPVPPAPFATTGPQVPANPPPPAAGLEALARGTTGVGPRTPGVGGGPFPPGAAVGAAPDQGTPDSADENDDEPDGALPLWKRIGRRLFPP
jgi:hypothetical protein